MMEEEGPLARPFCLQTHIITRRAPAFSVRAIIIWDTKCVIEAYRQYVQFCLKALYFL